MRVRECFDDRVLLGGAWLGALNKLKSAERSKSCDRALRGASIHCFRTQLSMSANLSGSRKVYQCLKSYQNLLEALAFGPADHALGSLPRARKARICASYVEYASRAKQREKRENLLDARHLGR